METASKMSFSRTAGTSVCQRRDVHSLGGNHADWSWDHAGSPMLVVDLDADGRNDVIWGDGHNYGLY